MTDLATTTCLRTHQVPYARRGVVALLVIALMLARAPKLVNAEEPTFKLATPAAAAASEASPPKGPIQYVGPDTYILLDAQGRPQPVPGMTYEDFLAAWKKLNQPVNQQAEPRYTIEHITFVGKANRERAELKFNAVVHLL